MVKATLSGKRTQTTTCHFGRIHQQWVGKACGTIMLIVDGELTACTTDRQGIYLMDADTGEFITTKSVRVYRSTIVQIRAMLGHGG